MLLHKFTDKDLVSSYINGNPNALDELVNRHQSRVMSFINSKVRNQQLAEDIFQDAFIKVIKSLNSGKYNEEGKFLPWLMRISHNLIIDFFRKNNRMPKAAQSKELENFDIFDVIGNGDASKEYDMMEEEQTELLKRLISELPEEQREVLMMRHYEDLSFKEISEKTGVSINTSLGRMRYALINIRKLMVEHNVDLMIN
jgi:RNA polymerase sigma-70 factor (ECF subfamily)